MGNKQSTIYSIFIRKILSTFGYFYPFYSGGGKLSQLSIFELFAPKDPCLISLKNGKKLCLNPIEYFQRTVYYFRDYDPKVTFFCRKLLDRGDIFLDIGANIGVIFLNCADILQEEGQIHAFEPNPKLIDYLRKTLVANPDNHNIFIHPIGLSDRDRTAQLYIEENNVGCASISRNYHGKQISINIRDSLTIFQDLLGSNNNPYVIKIDVEGHEITILERIKDFISSRKPKAIIFEFNEVGINIKESEIFHLLRQINLEVYAICRGALLQPYLKSLPDTLESLPSNDYVAIDKNQINWLSKKVKIKDK